MEADNNGEINSSAKSNTATISKLTEQANAIIEQEAQTEEDITQLQKIRWRLANEYHDVNISAGLADQMYNVTKSEGYIVVKQNKRDDGKPYTDRDADIISRNKSEKAHGHYRALKAQAQSIKALISALEAFCVDYYTKRKSEKDALLTTRGDG